MMTGLGIQYVISNGRMGRKFSQQESAIHGEEEVGPGGLFLWSLC